MADIMGSGGLAFYQWKKHGRCSGLSADRYFDHGAPALRRARPAPRRDDGRATAAAVEAALSPPIRCWAPEAVIVTCGDGRVSEVPICLTREFAPRECSADVRRDACRVRGPLDLPPAD